MTPQHLAAGSLVTGDQMRAHLAELAKSAVPPPELPPPVSPERLRLRESVVLLDYFSPGDLPRLRPMRGTPSDPDAVDDVDEFVATDCEVVTTRTATRWRLHLDARHETLGRLGPIGALEANGDDTGVRPGKDDVAHAMAVWLLRRVTHADRPGPAHELSGLTPTQLSGILRAREWLAPLGLDLPGEAEVRRALDLANVLAPLRAVARDDFVGRAGELAVLGSFVAGVNGFDDLPVLALHGPGGVGKSALLAKFVLDRIEGRGGRIGFAYLTFDRADLDPASPLTLVREMLRQLGLQEPRVAERAAVLIQDVDSAIASEVAVRREIAASGGSSSGYGTRELDRTSLEQEYYFNTLAEVVTTAVGALPFVVLLDTFEVAQRRRRSSLHVLRRALASMATIVPNLRVLVAGRAEATELTDRTWALTGLDADQARLLLHRATADLSVPDDLVDDVVERVHGNPLSLRLAAELMRREGEESLRTRSGRRRFLFGLRDEQVQGILYRRILDHIDARVQPLANPGLVVRRITPDVIRRVLAKPCGLGRITPAQADELFDVLAAEAGLVTEMPGRVLVHREDVRREMLPLLRDESPESAARVDRIHRLAVAYYKDRPGLDDRVEELYHRLMLGQSDKTLESRWDDSAGFQLESAMPELPPASRVFLANKHPDAEANPEDLLAAGYAAWVAQATRKARRLLDSGLSEQATELLHTGPTPDTRDPEGFPEDALAITALKVQAHAASRRRDYALEIARKGIEAAERRALPREYVELTILAGRVAEDDERFDEAWRYFRDGRESAVDLALRIPAMEAAAGGLRVSRRAGWDDTRRDTRGLRALKQQLIVEATGLTAAEKQQYPTLLRELAAEVGDAVPDLLAEAADRLGGDFSSSKGFDELFEQDPTRSPGPTSAPAQGRTVAEALRERPDDDWLRSSTQSYWQGEADKLSFDAYDDQGK